MKSYPLFCFSELAFIVPEAKRVLERLSHMPDVNVIIISGREMTDLRTKVRITW
jgi:trehalose-6-phosphatase